MKEIFPGIFQMTLTLSGFSPSSVNIYLVKDHCDYLLIDTGWDTPESVQSMYSQISEAGIDYSRVRRVIVTHCHIDHMGMIGKLKESNKARFYIHQNELELIRIRFNDGDTYIPMTDKFLESHGVPLSELAQPDFVLPPINLAQPDVLLAGGEEIAVGEYILRVINTPGHTPGHISLYEPSKKLLFSGDVLLPTIATNAAFHVQHMVNPLQQYLNSLATLRKLEIDFVIPGHEYIFSNHRQRIDELVLRHQQKDQEIMQAFTGGEPRTAYDVSQIISWSPRNRISKWTQLSGWDKRFAMLQTIAHLEEMAGSGQLSRFCSNGKIYYS
jgi:glyoxylase-like metal-dependent hydrolase (beta-lactamase superfamily II)